MSSRFHNKFHRGDHHTDFGDDYIGNAADPFKGDFHITKGLSAGDVTAESIHANYLSAYSAEINVLDLTVTEASGFIAQGDDFNPDPPASVDPDTDPVVLLENIGLYSDSWVSFGNNLAIGTNITANNIVLSGAFSAWDPDYIAWNSTYTTVRTLSNAWGPPVDEYGSAYSAVCASSGSWSSTHSTVCASSALWSSVLTPVCSISADLQAKDYFNFFPKIGIEKQGTTPSGVYVEFTDAEEVPVGLIPVANSEVFLGGYIVPLSAGPELIFDYEPDFPSSLFTPNYIFAVLANKSSWPSNNNKPYAQIYTTTVDAESTFKRLKLAVVTLSGDPGNDDLVPVIQLSSITNNTTRLFESSASKVDDLHRHYKISDVTFTDRISASLTITNTSYLEISANGSIKYLPLFDFT